jgi:broad specificity phosphatase PhoE
MKSTTLLKRDWVCTEVVLIRHGESSNNCIYEQVRQRFGNTLNHEDFEAEVDKLHDPDCGLSPKGILQAEALSNHLKENTLEMMHDFSKWKIYSSPMKRCLLTTQQVVRGLGDKEVYVHPCLFESDGCYKAFSDGTTIGLPGMDQETIESMFPQFHCFPGMENGWFHLKEKETRKQFYERSKVMVDFLWNEHEKNHIQSAVMKEIEEEEEVFTPSSETSFEKGEKDSEKKKENQNQEGIMIIAHGNIIASIISSLVNTNALIANCNTGINHIQLWSHKVTKQRLCSIIFTNRVPHFNHKPELHGGEQIFEDHWIQEFLEPEDL